MKSVKATTEGLIGQTTASGYRIDNVVPFVALPSRRALRKFIRVRNPATGVTLLAIVLDVGPWNTDDDAYVFGDARPQAESGVDKSGRKTNGAGIDLGRVVWQRLLDPATSGMVEWEFVDVAGAVLVTTPLPH